MTKWELLKQEGCWYVNHTLVSQLSGIQIYDVFIGINYFLTAKFLKVLYVC